MSFLVSVYNYPILSLDKEFVNHYIELGIQIFVFTLTVVLSAKGVRSSDVYGEVSDALEP